MNIIGNVENKTCIIVDDIIDSGTIANVVDALKKGAKEVFVFITMQCLVVKQPKKLKIQK